jgi:hypothetical protein
MRINYWWISVVVLLIIILVVWLIRRNRKDEKTFKQELIQSELKPEDAAKDKDDPVTS